MSDYKIIDGLRYERALLEHATALVSGAGDGRISYDDARALIDNALDGGRITRTERRTLHFIFENFKLTDKAQDYLVEKLFKLDDTKTYDRVLIDAADLAIEGRGDGRVSLDDAELIWRMVESDGKITGVERRTIAYILEAYKCTEPAEAFLRSKID